MQTRLPLMQQTYVRQTGWSFLIRFNEHKQVFHTNSHTSKFAQHLLYHNHPFGTIHNTVQTLRHHRNFRRFNTLERFHIHAEYLTNSHINDNQTIFPNRIFDVLLKVQPQNNPALTPTL
jgi:hypothetical protein